LREIIKRIERLEEKAKRFLPIDLIIIKVHFIKMDGTIDSTLIINGKGEQ